MIKRLFTERYICNLATYSAKIQKTNIYVVAKFARSRSFIFANFDPKMPPSSQNWILTRVFEVKLFDPTNDLAIITRFWALRARGAREAGFFFMEICKWVNGFWSQNFSSIPLKMRSLSTKKGKLRLCNFLKTHHSGIYLMRADVPIVLLYSVVPSLASLAPEQQ